MVTQNPTVENKQAQEQDSAVGGIILAYVLCFELLVAVVLGVARYGLHLY